MRTIYKTIVGVGDEHFTGSRIAEAVRYAQLQVVGVSRVKDRRTEAMCRPRGQLLVLHRLTYRRAILIEQLVGPEGGR